MKINKEMCGKEVLMPIDSMLKELISISGVKNIREKVLLNETRNRTAYASLISEINSPQFNNSAMDGYGLCMKDNEIGKPGIHTYLQVSEVFAGSENDIKVGIGECVRIFTGARIPDGVNAVVYQEACEDNEGIIEVYKPVNDGDNIRTEGEDIKAGETILTKNCRIDSYKIAEMASVGIKEVEVFRKPKVGVFFTGDELKNPGDRLEQSDIYNTNEYMLVSLIKDIGCDIVSNGIIKDNINDTKLAIKKLSKECDVIITTGGVSVGEADFVKTAIEELGEVRSWKVNMKPGKPVVVGSVNGKTIIGLPGNPVSAAVGFFVFVKPLLKKLSGVVDYMNKFEEIEWTLNTQAPRDRDEYIRCRLGKDNKIEMYNKQGSNIISSMSWADGLIKLEADKVYRKGDKVEYYKIK